MSRSDWEDRSFARTPLQLHAPVVDTRSGRFLSGRTRDGSLGGVFVETDELPPVGVLVDVFLGGIGIGPQMLARVVRAVPGDGFAAAFLGDTSGIRALLG